MPLSKSVVMPLRYKHFWLFKDWHYGCGQDYRPGDNPPDDINNWEHIHHWLCSNPRCAAVLVSRDPETGQLELENGYTWSKVHRKYVWPENRIRPRYSNDVYEMPRGDPEFLQEAKYRAWDREATRWKACDGRKPVKKIILKSHWLPALIRCARCRCDSIICKEMPLAE